MKIKNYIGILYHFMWIVLLVSCSVRETQLEDDITLNNAMFIIEEVTKPKNLPPVILNATKGLPSHFILNLRTCIKDAIRKDSSIQNTIFFVEYENKFTPKSTKKKSLQKVKTISDSNGCIQWQETYKYKFVNHAQWIQLNRVIKTEHQAYKGEVVIPMAVNPWLNKEDREFPIILDLRKKHSTNHDILKSGKFQKQGLKFLSQTKKENYLQLWVPKIEVQLDINYKNESKNYENNACNNKKFTKQQQKICKSHNIKALLNYYKTKCTSAKNKDCYKRRINMHALIPLNLRNHSINGNISNIDIRGGLYDIKAQLIVMPFGANNLYSLHNKLCEYKNIALNKNKDQDIHFLDVKCNMDISLFNRNAHYKIFIQVKPTQQSQLLFKPFQGFYTINLDFTGIKKPYRLDNGIDQKYKSILNTDKNINLLTQNPISSLDESFNSREFYSPQLDGRNEFKFSHIENTDKCLDNESVVKRTIIFVGDVCLTDTLVNKLYTQTSFRVFTEHVELQKGNSGDKESIIQEIFRKDDQKTFSTDQQGCIKLALPIKHNFYDRQRYFSVNVYFLSEKLNLYAKVNVALNPWHRAFQAHQDATKLAKPDIRFNTRGVQKPQLIINLFKSVNLFPSYVLDKLLNMHLYHRIYLLFQPFITRHDSVDLGQSHRSRELLRDGYYMTRLLFIRNPQEVSNMNRVLHQSEIKSKISDQKINKEINFNLDKATYITHTDTIVKAEANFVNLYMPLYITNRQLYYTSSRNLISIEIVPVDPKGFVFKPLSKENDVCELDMKKTEWKPFFNHELVNRPYIGAFNIQNWTNWNILKKIDSLDSDSIINTSNIGVSHKHFNLKSNPKPSINHRHNIAKKLIPTSCSGSGTFKEDPSAQQIELCTNSKLKNNLSVSKIHKQIEQETNLSKFKSSQILTNYASQNILKILHLSDTEQSDQFTRDMTKALNKVTFESSSSIESEQLEQILNSLPYTNKQELQKLIKRCPRKYVIFKDMDCINQIIQKYIDQLNLQKQTDDVSFANYSDSSAAINQLDTLKTYTKITKPFVSNLINKKISQNNSKTSQVLTFARSLCYFWFDSFLSKYLEKKQMQEAYMNYIKQINYYKILNTHTLTENDKFSEFQKFLDLTGLNQAQKEDETGLKACHKNYTQCIVADHCKLNQDNKKAHGSYCRNKQIINTLNKSCMAFAKTTCSNDKSKLFCELKLNDKQCHASVHNFCENNKTNESCNTYSNRCVSQYNSCIQDPKVSAFFNTKNILKFDCFKNHELEYQKCLDDPSKYNKNCLLRFTKARAQKDKLCTTKFQTKSQNPKALYFKRTRPLKQCLENPYSFFKFENKMMVYELSKQAPVYKGGILRNLITTGGFSISSYSNWTDQHSNNLSISASGKMDFLKFLDVKLSASESMSVSQSFSDRRSTDTRISESAMISVEQNTIDISVTKFQKCLVIKPRPNAFSNCVVAEGLTIQNEVQNTASCWKDQAKNSDIKKILVSKPGFIICNPVQERDMQTAEIITEDYYYTYQNNGDSNSVRFLNLYDLANRPFVNIFRGRSEFLKFYHISKGILNDNSEYENQDWNVDHRPNEIFSNYPFPIERSVELNLSTRQFNETGFYKGVYHYSNNASIEWDNLKNQNKESSISNSIFSFSKTKILSLPK